MSRTPLEVADSWSLRDVMMSLFQPIARSLIHLSVTEVSNSLQVAHEILERDSLKRKEISRRYDLTIIK